MRDMTAEKKKYFVLNKETDFAKGFGRGIQTADGGIGLEEGTADGVYYTKIFDSKERAMSWHRLKIEGVGLDDAFFRVTVYAADRLSLSQTTKTVAEVLADGGLLQEQKDALLSTYRQAEFEKAPDAPLFFVQGRYLWLKIELKDRGGFRPHIHRVQIYFPKASWLSYLPEIYAENQKSASFLERYLGIFQSIYEDMAQKIEDIPKLLEPSGENETVSRMLADWLSVENRELWTKEQLLYLVKNAARLYESRGTVSCFRELIRLYTGSEPYLVEYHAIRPYFDGGEYERLLKELYTSNRWEFAVLTDREEMGQGNRLFALEQIAETAKPAYMGCRFVVLRPYLFLNRHSYLGINSVLGQYKELRLDGLCAVSFSVLAANDAAAEEPL